MGQRELDVKLYENRLMSNYSVLINNDSIFLSVKKELLLCSMIKNGKRTNKETLRNYGNLAIVSLIEFIYLTCHNQSAIRVDLKDHHYVCIISSKEFRLLMVKVNHPYTISFDEQKEQT